ncbi:MAG: carbamoyl-phosphate synthase large subunit, partial [Carnobacterium sp.]
MGTATFDMIHSQGPTSFEKALDKSGIPKSISTIVTNKEAALSNAKKIGYPILMRPVSKFNEKKLEIIESEQDLEKYMTNSSTYSPYSAVLITQYIKGIEVEVDAISDGTTILIPGMVEYIERSEIHTGDSMAVYPPQSLNPAIKETIIQYTKQLAKSLNCIGLINCKFVIFENDVYISRVHLHASRTVPFLSKVTGIPIVELATNVLLGQSLKSQGFEEGLAPESS